LDKSVECAEEVMKIDYGATMRSQHLLGLVPGEMRAIFVDHSMTQNPGAFSILRMKARRSAPSPRISSTLASCAVRSFAPSLSCLQTKSLAPVPRWLLN